MKCFALNKLFVFLVVIVACFTLESCDNDSSYSGYSGAGALIEKYEGFWSCINTESKEGYAPEGTIMKIDASGGVTWQKPNGEMSTGIFRILNSEWMEVTYAGSTFRAEWWEGMTQGQVILNVNQIQKGASFPFYGRFKKMQ
ncbi:MAG: hypothetical protein MJZ19_11850 [Paludibacteraceae bacterium]|nr:hypothetical protein [Paludibacteraceae bacterium]